MKEKPNVRQTKFRFKNKKEEENRNAIMFYVQILQSKPNIFFNYFYYSFVLVLVFLFQVFKDATQPETYIEIDFGIY